MMHEYNVVFKLPCEKTFTFDILVCNDGYDPTTEVGNYPSKYMLDYFLLYIPQLQDYSGSEISNGIVMSVFEKKDSDINSTVTNDKTESEPKHKAKTKPSLKSLYWKNGYIFKTRENGYGIISNDVVFCEHGSFHKFDLDESLMSNSPHRANDIIEVWCNSSTRAFNPYVKEEIHKCCNLVWSRPIEMSREEIEQKLNLSKGSLVITD